MLSSNIQDTPHSVTVKHVQNSQNNFLILGDYNEQKVVNPAVLLTERTPGWPDKWPTPEITPLPFRPPGFSISLDQLTAAVEALPAHDREACNQGDVSATTRLLIELLRQVHADPAERNVYMNPRRGDQALVYMPEHWETCQLDEAGLILIGRVAAELGHIPKAAPQGVRRLALAARQNMVKQGHQVAKTSRASLAAHLENVRQQTMSGEDWLGAILTNETEQLSFFGYERDGHLDAEGMALAVEQVAGLWSDQPIPVDKGPDLASLALQQCAHAILTGHPENLTAVPNSTKDVYIHTRTGWESVPYSKAAQIQARRVASTLVDCISAAAPTSYARHLLPWLDPESETIRLIGDKGVILARYLSSATKYYGSLPLKGPLTDRRQIARNLAQQSLTLKQIDTPSLTNKDENEQPPAFTDDELRDILGFVPDIY